MRFRRKEGRKAGRRDCIVEEWLKKGSEKGKRSNRTQGR